MAPTGTPVQAFFASVIKRNDMRALWRLGAWGAGAALALGLVAVAVQTERGRERIQSAFSGFGAPVRAAAIAEAQKRAVDAQAESQRLATRLRDLAADRDRLAARVAGLEHNVEDITGSIKRQAELAVAAAAPTAADLPKITAAAAAAPVAPSPAAPPKTEPPEAIRQDGAVQAAEPPSRIEASVAAPVASPPPPIASPPAIAAASRSAPPPAEPRSTAAAAPLAPPVPVRQLKVASAPPEPVPVPPQPIRPDIAIDIGGSSTLALLNARWKTVKANHGPLLVGLRPLVVHENRPGRLPYRLVLGPLANTAAAARLCAQFAAAHAACHLTHFTGNELTPH